MPRNSSRTSRYGGNVLIEKCAKTIRDDLPKLSNTDTRIRNAEAILKHIYDTMSKVPITDARSREDVQKMAIPSKKDPTVDDLLEAYYKPRAEKEKASWPNMKRYAILELIKDNLNVSTAPKADNKQIKHFRIMPSDYNKDAPEKICQFPKDKYEQCVLDAVSANFDKDLPPIPAEYASRKINFMLTDENLVCDTDFYNPGLQHMLQDKKLKALLRGSARRRSARRSARRGSCRR